MHARPLCRDCGNQPTIHSVERFFALFTTIATPLLYPLELLRRSLERFLNPFFEKLNLYMMGLFAGLGLGRFVDAPDRRTPARAVTLWKSAKQRGIAMYQFYLFGRPLDSYIAKYGERVISFDGLPRPANASLKAIDWMENKAVLRKKFKESGIPIAVGGVAWTLHTALNIFHDIPHPVVVKPNSGSQNRHTTLEVNDQETLKVAFHKAKQISPRVIIERHLQGDVYRATVIGGRVISVVRQEVPHVIGNGHSKIQTLVEIENHNPKRSGPLFHTLPINLQSTRLLRKQGWSWDDVPPAGKKIILDTKTNREAGGIVVDVTDEVHLDNIGLFEKVGIVLDDALIGVDFVVKDIGQSWKKQSACGVIAANSLPGLDLCSDPYYGKGRDAAGALWSVVFASRDPVA